LTPSVALRTLKHASAYPTLPFADLEAARRWVTRFVAWYNGEHRHSGIRYVTPDQRHFGEEKAILAHRSSLYELARHELVLGRDDQVTPHTGDLQVVGRSLEPHVKRRRNHASRSADKILMALLTRV
jgi:hypothetical protein